MRKRPSLKDHCLLPQLLLSLEVVGSCGVPGGVTRDTIDPRLRSLDDYTVPWSICCAACLSSSLGVWWTVYLVGRDGIGWNLVMLTVLMEIN